MSFKRIYILKMQKYIKILNINTKIRNGSEVVRHNDYYLSYSNLNRTNQELMISFNQNNNNY